MSVVMEEMPMSDLLVLHHFTSPEAARAIVDQQVWHSEENTGKVYASNREDGEATAYGKAIVHVLILAASVELDDEFPGGERHYRFKPDEALVIGITT